MHAELSSLPTRGAAPDGSRELLYTRRCPEQSVLYGVVQAELEGFLAHARARERGVPRFVERELRAFLACGILAHGFVRVRCDACARERLVAFSCKGRGFCPPAAAAAWPTPRRTSSTVCYPRLPCGSGCSRCPSRSATAWNATRPYGIAPGDARCHAQRARIKPDALARDPSFQTYGPRTRREFLDLLRLGG